MPECAEVARVVDECNALGAWTVRAASSSDARLADVADALTGARFERNGFVRRGKFIQATWVDTAQQHRSLLLHLRMTGTLRLCERGQRLPYERLRLSIDGEGVSNDLLLCDVRKFATVGIDRQLPVLGPDVLDSHAVVVKALVADARTQRPVKAVLLDQRVVAGVGNYGADEALHLARVNPATVA